MVRTKQTPKRFNCDGIPFDYKKLQDRLILQHQIKEIDVIRHYRPGEYVPGPVFYPTQDGRRRSCAISKNSFNALLQEVMQNNNITYRFKPLVVNMLQEASENYITDLFKDANMCAMRLGREMITVVDLKLALRIRGK